MYNTEPIFTRPRGRSKVAAVAGPPIPEKPAFPFPATSVNAPSGERAHTWFVDGSAIYNVPWGPNASGPGEIGALGGADEVVARDSTDYLAGRATTDSSCSGQNET